MKIEKRTSTTVHVTAQDILDLLLRHPSGVRVEGAMVEVYNPGDGWIVVGAGEVVVRVVSTESK